MMDIAPAMLADEQLPDKPGFTRKIAKEPIGTVFVMAPWNYPLLTGKIACNPPVTCAFLTFSERLLVVAAGNAVFPAILAGNAVLIKQSPRKITSNQEIYDRTFFCENL